MFPRAQEEDPLFINAPIYIKEGKSFTKTDDVCICPRSEAESKGFKGLVQSNTHLNAMKILIVNNNKFSTKKFLCIKCLQIRSSDGGNLSRHYQNRCINSSPHVTEQNVYSVLLFCINHYVPLTSLSNEDGKMTFPNFPSYPTILHLILELKNKVQKHIQKEIDQISKITIECDGWTHPSGIRFLGIVLRYPLGDSVVEAPVEIIDTPDFTLGSNEMCDLIEITMEKMKIARKKWLSISSDGANDMNKLAKKLDLEWDRCILHLLHLKIQKFWKSSLERLQKVHEIAAKLHKKTKWCEFILNHANEFPELGRKRNFTIGCDTRWCTHLDECKELVLFRDPIMTFQKMKWNKKHKSHYVENPDKNILQSDFEMIIEILPLFDIISKSFKILESRELYLSKMGITICFIQDEIYNFVTKNSLGNWHDNCYTLIESINNDIFYSKTTFARNILASVLLDPAITIIPTQIQSQKDSIISYIKSTIDSDNMIFSQPIQKVEQNQMDLVEQKFCSPIVSEYDDEVIHWFEKVRPNGNEYNNPFEYWKKHVGHPNLKKFALRLFVHAGSSLACERFFSICSHIASDKRSSMTPENFSALCIVKANIDLARKILLDEDNLK